MWIGFVFVALALLFFLYAGFLFAGTVFEVILNGAIIAAIGLRTHVEVAREGKAQPYAVGAVFGLLLLFFFGRLLDLWAFTSWMMYAFLIAQMVLLVLASYSASHDEE